MGNSCIPARPTDLGDPPPEGTHKVQLATSELFSLAALATAYHTSVVVDGAEYFFSDSGIFCNHSVLSHEGYQMELHDMGMSRRTGQQLTQLLRADFSTGTYDLIRKNCNTFSDCALYLLLQNRLPKKYSALERLGQKASMDMIHRVTKGAYQPNQACVNFSVEEIVSKIDKLTEADFADVARQAEKPGCLNRSLIGAEVVICGLTKAEHLNGQKGQILRYNAVNGRWEVRLSSNDVKALRAENIRPYGETIFAEGTTCIIHGLKSEVGRELNGQRCEVLQYLQHSLRYEVRFGDKTKALKAENLRVAQPLDP